MNETRTNYGVHLDLPGSLAALRPRVEAALQAEGFGVLTEIDVAATLKAKLGEDVPAQLILGACNPPLAHAALGAEADLGLLLPCNVTLRALPGDRTRVGFMDVEGMMAMVGNPALEPVARAVAERLTRVRAALAEGA